MPLEIVMPKLGLTMTEGLIVEWKFKEGDKVKKGDILFLLETEKVTYEVEAAEDSVLAKIVIPENDTVPVGRSGRISCVGWRRSGPFEYRHGGA